MHEPRTTKTQASNAHIATDPVTATRIVQHGAVLLLLFGYLVVIALTFNDYGITFDEKWHSDYGSRILWWYSSGMRDRASLEAPILYLTNPDPNYANMSYYGGFFDAVAEVAVRLSPLGLYETRHLVNALFGVAGVLFAYLIGLTIAGRTAGLCAALFLMLTPFYFGHAFNNPKDLPFAVLYLASLYGTIGIVQRLPAPGWRRVALTGIAIGLTMAVRIAGIVLLGYLAILFVVWCATRPRAEWSAAVRGFAPRLAACAAIAYVVMLPWWPAALMNPVLHPFRALRALNAFQWNHLVRFDGQDTRAQELPWYYIEKYALLTLPEFVLLGLGAALVFGVLAFVRRQARDSRNVHAVGSLLLAAVFPLVYADIAGVTAYDAQRHFLFVFPPLIVLAGLGIARALRASRPVALFTAATVSAGVTLTVVEMVRLHPHQYIFFNRLIAGGLEHAHERYETDYWGNAFKEASEWVSANYQPTAGERIRVAGCGSRTSTAYFLPRTGFQYVAPDEEPQLFLGAKRFHCWDKLNGPVVHTVERRGAPLVVIKEVASDAASLRRTPTARRARTEQPLSGALARE